MPELNGIVVARRLTEELPGVKLMILTLHEDRSYIKQALDAACAATFSSVPPPKAWLPPFAP